MGGIKEKINVSEARYFYTSPDTLIGNGTLSSFGLIRSIIEVFDYYGVKEFTASDAHEIFTELQIVQSSNGRVFSPSVRKISGVFDCYVTTGRYSLSKNGDLFRIESWDHTGYEAEINYARSSGKLH